MKDDILIKIDKQGYVYKDKAVLGINNENIVTNIVFEFVDTFVDGIGWLEIQMPDGTKNYVALEKTENSYRLPVKSSLLTQIGKIYMQLRITENENPNGIPVLKSSMFYMKVLEAINSTTEIPDEYPTWIEMADQKLLEVDEALQDIIDLRFQILNGDLILTVGGENNG